MNIGSLSSVVEAKTEQKSIGDKAYRVATFPLVVGSGITGGIVGGVSGAAIGGLTGAVIGGSVGCGLAKGVLYGNIDSRQKMANIGKKFKNLKKK